MFVYGIAIIILTYYLAHDRILFLNFRENTWQYIALPIQYGLPVLLLLALVIRKIFKLTPSKQ
jgi:spore germination protein KB